MLGGGIKHPLDTRPEKILEKGRELFRRYLLLRSIGLYEEFYSRTYHGVADHFKLVGAKAIKILTVYQVFLQLQVERFKRIRRKEGFPENGLVSDDEVQKDWIREEL